MPKQEIFKLYRQLELWRNPICLKCRAAAKPPVNGPASIWRVGDKYTRDPYRLVFVGKVARGGDEPEYQIQLKEQGFMDWTSKTIDDVNQFRGFAYWGYTFAIIERLFESLDDGWDRIAFTNLIKCNNSWTTDTTTEETAENCLDKLQVTWKELEILKPRNIIFYTGRWYDDFIERFTSRFEPQDITSREHTVKNGAKRLCWWERNCFAGDALQFRVLRTGHPERQKKQPFVARLVKWIRNSPPST